jgi:hypothetical protein
MGDSCQCHDVGDCTIGHRWARELGMLDCEVRISSRGHPISLKWTPWALSLDVKQQGRENYHWPRSNAEVKNGWAVPYPERCDLASNTGGGETKSTLGIWKLHLQRCQVRNGGKFGVNQSIIHIHPFPPSPNSFYMLLFKSVAQKIYS